MKALPRKEREKLRRRQEILQAAEQVFASKGFHGTTVHEIARTAELAVGTIYQYFSSKEELYTTLILEKATEFADTIISATRKTRDPVKRIQILIEQQLQILEDDKEFFRLLGPEADSRVPRETRGRLHMGFTAIFQRYLESIAKIFSDGIKQGTFKKYPPMKLAIALTGMLNGFTANWYRSGFKGTLRENSDIILRIFLKNVQLTR